MPAYSSLCRVNYVTVRGKGALQHYQCEMIDQQAARRLLQIQ